MNTQTKMQQIISDTLAMATPGDITQGLHWYIEANEFAVNLADTYNLPVYMVCGIISALSPRCRWYKNKRHAIMACEGYFTAIPTFNKIKDKARAMLIDGLHPLEVMGKTAPKTTAFYHNIFSAGQDTDHVTIDIWIIRLLSGDKHRQQVSPKQYNTIAQAIKNVAQTTDYTPAQVQAICWIVARNTRHTFYQGSLL
jgi:hypothetical protein